MNREGKTSLLRFRGETGKHKGFKNLRVLTLVGSNPIGSTINQKIYIIMIFPFKKNQIIKVISIQNYSSLFSYNSPLRLKNIKNKKFRIIDIGDKKKGIRSNDYHISFSAVDIETNIKYGFSYNKFNKYKTVWKIKNIKFKLK